MWLKLLTLLGPLGASALTAKSEAASKRAKIWRYVMAPILVFYFALTVPCFWFSKTPEQFQSCAEHQLEVGSDSLEKLLE